MGDNFTNINIYYNVYNIHHILLSGWSNQGRCHGWDI